MSINIMDANAITAFLRGEVGHEVVAAYLVGPAATNIIHAVDLCEVYYDALRAGGQPAADEAVAKTLATGTGLRTDLDPTFWRLIGDLKVNPGKLSLADCFALALAIQTGGTLVTADHHKFDAIVSLNLCPILFFRQQKNEKTNCGETWPVKNSRSALKKNTRSLTRKRGNCALAPCRSCTTPNHH